MEDSLSTFLSFIESLSSIPATMAIILINTEESYDLDEKFNSHRGDMPVPIVVVKRKVGLGLLQQLERHPRKVIARIEGEESSKLEIPKAGDSPEIKDDRGETYHVHIYVHTYTCIHVQTENHNSLGCEQPSVLTIRQIRICFGQYQSSSAVHVHVHV